MWVFLFSKKKTNFQAFHWGISSSIRSLISEECLPFEYTITMTKNCGQFVLCKCNLTSSHAKYLYKDWACIFFIISCTIILINIKIGIQIIQMTKWVRKYEFKTSFCLQFYAIFYSSAEPSVCSTLKFHQILQS